MNVAYQNNCCLHLMLNVHLSFLSCPKLVRKWHNSCLHGCPFHSSRFNFKNTKPSYMVLLLHDPPYPMRLAISLCSPSLTLPCKAKCSIFRPISSLLDYFFLSLSIPVDPICSLLSVILFLVVVSLSKPNAVL